MERILVPVDFSEASENALNYAIEFAKELKGQIYLLNVYDYIAVPNDPIVWIPSMDDIIEDHMQKLEVIRKKIISQHGNRIKIKCYCEPGTVIEAVNTFVIKHHMDLVIMGMQGGGYVSEKIIGSTTTSLMRKAACPVLGIAMHVKYRPISSIVLATDYEDADYKKILKPLIHLVQKVNAHLHILYVVEPEVSLDAGIVTGVQVSRALKEIPYTVHTLAHEDISEAVDQFVSDKLIDITVIVPRKHSFFYSVFHEPNTKKIAFHTTIPLLTLHE